MNFKISCRLLNYTVVTVFCFVFSNVFSQNSKIDSLLSILKTASNDSNKVKTLFRLGYAYNSNKVRKFDKTILLSNDILELSEKINFKKGLYYYHDLIGYSYYKNGENEKAITALEKAVSYFLSTNQKIDAARAYGNLGNCYYRLNLYPKSLDCFIKALKIYEKLNRKLEIAGYSGNIGAIYNSIGNNEKALEFYEKALKINEEIKSEQNTAINLVCIGNAYNDLNNYALALEYYQKALPINEKLDNKEYYANNLFNIGNIKANLKEYQEAQIYLKKALGIFEEIKEEDSKGKVLAHIGSVNNNLSNYQEALQNLTAALKISEAHKDIKNQIDCYKELSKLYYNTKDFKSSIDNYKKYIVLKDSLDNESNQKSILRKQMEYDFEKKEALTKAEFIKEQTEKQLEIERRKQAIALLEKDNALKELNLSQSNYKLKEKEAESESQKKQVELLNKNKMIQEALAAKKTEELEQQKLLRNIFSGGAILLLGFAFFILRSLKQSRKANKIIALQKLEVEHQKHIVEEKQKEIVDSINYAQRIQYALLTNKSVLDRYLKDYFLFFKPKDVVSGDFYWASELSNQTFALVTADSTGHGVPGAIMSMLNMACLNEAANDSQQLTRPSDILNKTRHKIINHLMNDGSAEGGKDGMDCSLICFDFKQKKLTYAAANNPVWIARGQQIISLKPDKMPVGKHEKDHESFNQTEIDLLNGDVIYTFTDGYADQFGGPKGKKFKYKQMEELLLSISQKPMQEQHQIIKTTFENWKGDLEQIDDVCVIGIRIT